MNYIIFYKINNILYYIYGVANRWRKLFFEVLGVKSGSRGFKTGAAVIIINEGFKAYGARERVLSNRGLDMNAKEYLYEVLTALNDADTYLWSWPSN